MVFLIVIYFAKCYKSVALPTFWYCLSSSLIKTTVLRGLPLTFDTKRKAHLFENYVYGYNIYPGEQHM